MRGTYCSETLLVNRPMSEVRRAAVRCLGQTAKAARALGCKADPPLLPDEFAKTAGAAGAESVDVSAGGMTRWRYEVSARWYATGDQVRASVRSKLAPITAVGLEGHRPDWAFLERKLVRNRSRLDHSAAVGIMCRVHLSNPQNAAIACRDPNSIAHGVSELGRLYPVFIRMGMPTVGRFLNGRVDGAEAALKMARRMKKMTEFRHLDLTWLEDTVNRLRAAEIAAI